MTSEKHLHFTSVLALVEWRENESEGRKREKESSSLSSSNLIVRTLGPNDLRGEEEEKERGRDEQ